MQVINTLFEESFRYTGEKMDLYRRRDEIGEIMEIVAYCRNDLVGETLKYQDKIWEIPVQEGITFVEWLYENKGNGSAEDRRRLLEAFSKGEMTLLDETFPLEETAEKKTIAVALGDFPDAVCSQQDYIQKRRDILASIRNVQEYELFMRSCFVNSCFAEGILSEMKHIPHFPDRAKEITRALGILNDRAIELYRQYSNRLEEAMKILASLLRRECAPDPGHADDLIFSFTYSEQLEGKTEERHKEIECQPHFKLIHPGSDLRIYFYWCDETVGAGERVLVGRIGRHPY